MAVPPLEAWRKEHRIDALLNNPAVRFRIEQASQSASWYEQLLKKSPTAMPTAMFGVPGLQVAAVGAAVGLGIGVAQQRLFDALGLRVERTESITYPQPIGQVTVALLCALARDAYPIQRTIQKDDGCFLEAKLPLSLQSWEGMIACTVTGSPTGTDLQVGITMPGIPFKFAGPYRAVKSRIPKILKQVREYAESF